jgi:hypothetical protein
VLELLASPRGHAQQDIFKTAKHCLAAADMLDHQKVVRDIGPTIEAQTNRTIGVGQRGREDMRIHGGILMTIEPGDGSRGLLTDLENRSSVTMAVHQGNAVAQA